MARTSRAKRACRSWFTASALLACETSCLDPPANERFIRYDRGALDVTSTFYQSSPVAGPYLEFPPQRVIELAHRLPGTPVDIRAYLAFEETPFPRGFAAASGDLAVVRCADGRVLRVENTTCERFYVRVTAEYRELAEPPSRPCE